MKQNEVVPLPPGAAPNALLAEAAPVVPVANQAAAATTTPPPRGEPDLLIPPVTGLPLPQGGTMRKMTLDLLYENTRQGPEPEKKEEGRVGACGRRPKPKPVIVPLPRPDTGSSERELFLDGGDRLHRVAVVADVFVLPLRPPRLERQSKLPALRPKSKADCERRCGSDGFCDPSDPLGCGGMHCGRQRDMKY